jgi:16S rRNA (cytosine1402-N4)-methyltransferase
MSLHKPVFLDDVLTLFKAKVGPVTSIFDGTFGRGGHTRAMMAEWPQAKMFAFDWDEDAIAYGQENFKEEIAAGQLTLIRSNYSDFAKERAQLPKAGFDLMLLDLGVSSPQLDRADRGFSFYQDGPLDMRMDRRQELTAADICNTWDEQDLARLFIEAGEIQRPFRVVNAIVQDRKLKKPWETTRELATLIERIEGWHKKGSHPATRFFQALRLAVNAELTGLAKALPDLIQGLDCNGVLAVITFHSLEDRIVKNLFKENLQHGKLVNKKVIKPSDLEVSGNPRARSAKLRAFERGPI